MSEDDYEKIEVLGEGAFGKVWKVKRIKDGKIFALKVIQLANMSSDDVELIKNEIVMLGELSKSPSCNKSISCLYEAYQNSDEINIIMEYIDGRTLEDLVNEITPEQLENIFFQGIKNLNYLAEHGVLHRDIKPENIIYNPKTSKLVFVDVGISCTYNRSLVPCKGTPGTEKYIDPSVVLRVVPYNNPRSDVYSFGATMYALITKSSPKAIKNKNQIDKDYEIYQQVLTMHAEKLPIKFQYIVLYVEQMMIPDIQKRPTSFDIMNSFTSKLPVIKFIPIKINEQKLDLKYVDPTKFYNWTTLQSSIDELYENSFDDSNDEFEEEVLDYFKQLEERSGYDIPKHLRVQSINYIHGLTFPKEDD